MGEHDIVQRIDAFIAQCQAASCQELEPDAEPVLLACRAEIERMRVAVQVATDIRTLYGPQAWIPVSERLPPLLVEVLGWHAGDRVRAWFRHSGTIQGGPREGVYWEQWSPQDRECDDCAVDEPTHWMPLPEPPTTADCD